MFNLFKKRDEGTLHVRLSYQSAYHHSMTLSIKELRQTTPIAFEGKALAVPAGDYTLVLKGLLADPSRQSTYHDAYKEVYGSFELTQQVSVVAGRTTLCTFELPGETHKVNVRVVMGGQDVDGADVLIQKADPNFRTTKFRQGTFFILEQGYYSIVVSYGRFLLRDVISVGLGRTSFIVELEKAGVAESKRTVARFRDGRMVKGLLVDFSPEAGTAKVTRANDGKEESIDLEQLKALFFVKSYTGQPTYNERKDFEIAKEFGRRAIVRFYDREELWGYVLAAELSDPGRKGFFFFPVDPETNNLKLYAVRSAVSAVTFG